MHILRTLAIFSTATVLLGACSSDDGSAGASQPDGGADAAPGDRAAPSTPARPDTTQDGAQTRARPTAAGRSRPTLTRRCPARGSSGRCAARPRSRRLASFSSASTGCTRSTSRVSSPTIRRRASRSSRASGVEYTNAYVNALDGITDQPERLVPRAARATSPAARRADDRRLVRRLLRARSAKSDAQLRARARRAPSWRTTRGSICDISGLWGSATAGIGPTHDPSSCARASIRRSCPTG